MPGGAIPPVAKDFEGNLFARKLDAGLLIDPVGNFLKCSDQELDVEMGFVREREIEIFGEPICLEIAFLQAGSALEYP